jgi:hypothetical protein
VPGIVFEEVDVKSVGQTVAGPHGPVHSAMVGQELHSDGTRGFRTAGGGDLEALALAVPADALQGPVPAALRTLAVGAIAVLESARIEEWGDVAATLRRVDAAAKSVLSGAPPLVAERLRVELAAFDKAVHGRRLPAIGQAAIDLGQSALDLELRYRPAAAVDADRFALWTQQLRVDAAAGDLTGVTGDVAVLEWIRDRFAFVLDPAARDALDEGLHELREAADARNLPAAADRAARLASLLRRS